MTNLFRTSRVTTSSLQQPDPYQFAQNTQKKTRKPAKETWSGLPEHEFRKGLRQLLNSTLKELKRRASLIKTTDDFKNFKKAEFSQLAESQLQQFKNVKADKKFIREAATAMRNQIDRNNISYTEAIPTLRTLISSAYKNVTCEELTPFEPVGRPKN